MSLSASEEKCQPTFATYSSEAELGVGVALWRLLLAILALLSLLISPRPLVATSLHVMGSKKLNILSFDIRAPLRD